MDDGVLKDQALTLWMKGQKHHLRGDFNRAIELYTKSLALYPTAEAYTFRGWAYSFQGRLDEAIDECKKAIAVDQTFGNPYNDIGSYLVNKGKLDEAIEWLERAPFDETEVEIRQVFEADDFGEAFTPELREQEEQMRAKSGMAAKAKS